MSLVDVDVAVLGYVFPELGDLGVGDVEQSQARVDFVQRVDAGWQQGDVVSDVSAGPGGCDHEPHSFERLPSAGLAVNDCQCSIHLTTGPFRLRG